MGSVPSWLVPALGCVIWLLNPPVLCAKPIQRALQPISSWLRFQVTSSSVLLTLAESIPLPSQGTCPDSYLENPGSACPEPKRGTGQSYTSDPRSGMTIPQLISSTPLPQEKPACSPPHRACLGPASYHTSHGVPSHLADTGSALLFFKRREGKMKSSLLLCLALAISMGLILVAGYPRDPEDKEYVLVNNKCKCVTMTSKFVPSKENPDEEILVRNIRIIVPLKARENISDPTSPLRTKFVYRMTDLCKKCDPIEVNLGGESYQTQPSSSCNDPEICYTYNRDKCYTTTLPFLYHGKVKNVPVALTPTSCYAD